VRPYDYDAILNEIGMHARASISLRRQAKTLTDMSKKHHVLALAFTRGAVFPSEVPTLADFKNLAKARDREFGSLRPHSARVDQRAAKNQSSEVPLQSFILDLLHNRHATLSSML
jgi:hypothetical protein